MGQFISSVVGGAHPVDTSASGMTLLFPSSDLVGEMLGIVDTAVEALAA